MLINQSAIALVHRMTQEDGAQPGQGLSPLKAILYFVGAPVALFAAITLLTLLFTSSRKKNSQISSID
jgi:hypothetical protein